LRTAGRELLGNRCGKFMDDVSVAGDLIQILVRAKTFADGEQAFAQARHRYHPLFHDAGCVVVPFMREGRRGEDNG
jgi:hypothetical protein